MATDTELETAASTSPFAAWTFEQAVTAIDTTLHAAAGGKAGFTANKAFVEANDHWQQGDTWMGPNGGGSAALRALVLAAVERQFTPVNVVGEVLENVANGLLKREADIQLVPVTPAGADGEPSDQQQEAIDAILTALASWWDRRRFWEQSRAAVRRARAFRHGPLRCWITPDTLVTTGEGEDATTALPTGLTFADALQKVQLMAPEPDVAIVYTDPDTQQRCALFRYTETITERKDGKDTTRAVEACELWYVEPGAPGQPGETVLTVLREGDAVATERYRVALGGRLPIAQVEGEVLITEPVRRQQNRLNFFESLLTRVGETAGFPERYTLNAAPYGVWLQTPPADGPALETAESNGTTWYLHRAPRTIGAAITTDLRGVKMTVDTADGTRESLATPGIVFKEPTDPAYAVTACEHARATILRECRQGHLATTATAESSGDAYEQARTSFENDLASTKGSLESTIREILEAAIAYAEAMSGVSEGGSRLQQYRIVVTCHVHAGPVSAAHRQVITQMYKDGMITRQTALGMIGIEDTAAELTALENDPLAKYTLLIKQAEALRAFTEAGLSIGAAALLCGFSEEDARRMEGSMDPEVEQ